MIDNNKSETGNSGEAESVHPEDSTVHQQILHSLRDRVSTVVNMDSSRPNYQEVSTTIMGKIQDVLQSIPDSHEKKAVSELLTIVIADACISYDIDPVMLIIIPKKLENNHIGETGAKSLGETKMYQLFIDPDEISFRLQILRNSGVSTSKNITDILFVLIHEMTHLGQHKHCEEEVLTSKEFEYDKRPTEIHADEQALQSCKSLLQNSGTVDNDLARQILQTGMSKTISEATEHRRPKM